MPKSKKGEDRYSFGAGTGLTQGDAFVASSEPAVAPPSLSASPKKTIIVIEETSIDGVEGWDYDLVGDALTNGMKRVLIEQMFEDNLK